VVCPEALQAKIFADIHPRQRPNNGDFSRLAARQHAGDGVTVFVVLESNPFERTLQFLEGELNGG
jgi:hypothetical protein